MKITQEILKELGFRYIKSPYISDWVWVIGNENDQNERSSMIRYDHDHQSIVYIGGEFEVIGRENITDVWELQEFVKCIQFLYPDISDEIQLNHPQSYYILQKDLPQCPKGRIFKQTTDKEWYYHSMSDEENMSGNYMRYEFSSSFVENNPEWFSKNKPN